MLLLPGNLINDQALFQSSCTHEIFYKVEFTDTSSTEVKLGRVRSNSGWVTSEA